MTSRPKVYPNFHVGINQLLAQFQVQAERVHTKRWQGAHIADKPEMATYEMLHPTIRVDMSSYEGGIQSLEEDTQPNMPWAENHFLERVSGQPMNPGTEWKNWPYGHSAAKFLDHMGKFNHNYMERYWPKFANMVDPPSDTAADFYSQWRDAKLIHPHRGIKYEYGDLGDVVKQLAEDPLTRQAYLPVWFPEDTGGGDKRAPCTIGYHFIMRDNLLDVTYQIRSCDLMRHFRDDVYLTVRLAEWVLEEVRKLNDDWFNVGLGQFHMHMTSLHVFVNDWRMLFPGKPTPDERT